MQQIYSGAWKNINYSADVKRTFINAGIVAGSGILISIFLLINKKK